MLRLGIGTVRWQFGTFHVIYFVVSTPFHCHMTEILGKAVLIWTFKDNSHLVPLLWNCYRLKKNTKCSNFWRPDCRSYFEIELGWNRDSTYHRDSAYQPRWCIPPRWYVPQRRYFTNEIVRTAETVLFHRGGTYHRDGTYLLDGTYHRGSAYHRDLRTKDMVRTIAPRQYVPPKW